MLLFAGNAEDWRPFSSRVKADTWKSSKKFSIKKLKEIFNNRTVNHLMNNLQRIKSLADDEIFV